MIYKILFILFVLALPILAEESDSTRVNPLPTVPADTTNETPAEKAMRGFEERYLKHQEVQKSFEPRFSFNDSIIAYFTSPRQNLRSSIDASYYKSTGNYFASEPSFFVLNHQTTPVRITAQPFGLTGNRLNMIVNGMELNPFEHVIEPDGLADLNDLPTSIDNDVFLLPGPLGQLLGGSQSLASLVTVPLKPENNDPLTAINHDRGSFGYNYTRGTYARKFSDDRYLDLGLEYRNADGDNLSNAEADDNYSYVGKLVYPLNQNYTLDVNGQLYTRDGSYQIHPDSSGAAISRDKFNRNIYLGLSRSDSLRTQKFEIGYHHRRDKSNLSGRVNSSEFSPKYFLFYNKTFNEAWLTREWSSGSVLLKAKATAAYDQYREGNDEWNRASGKGELSLAKISEGWRYAMTLGSQAVEEYRLLPFGSIVLLKDSEKSMFSISLGYSERAPSLYELNLKYQRSPVYFLGSLSNASDGNYANIGNEYLRSEKQLVGSVTTEIGTVNTSLRLSATGGQIYDAIDWRAVTTVESLSLLTTFSPSNSDLDFADLSAMVKVSLADNLSWKSGGAYHWIEYEKGGEMPYQPEYQAFSGMELHYFWHQRLLHLYAYGEILYTGPYDGYFVADLGKEPVFNAKLSFSIKNFRMHFVFQNLFSNLFQPREFNTNPGRYNYYGISWNFST